MIRVSPSEHFQDMTDQKRVKFRPDVLKGNEVQPIEKQTDIHWNDLCGAQIYSLAFSDLKREVSQEVRIYVIKCFSIFNYTRFVSSVKMTFQQETGRKLTGVEKGYLLVRPCDAPGVIFMTQSHGYIFSKVPIPSLSCVQLTIENSVLAGIILGVEYKMWKARSFEDKSEYQHSTAIIRTTFGPPSEMKTDEGRTLTSLNYFPCCLGQDASRKRFGCGAEVETSKVIPDTFREIKKIAIQVYAEINSRYPKAIEKLSDLSLNDFLCLRRNSSKNSYQDCFSNESQASFQSDFSHISAAADVNSNDPRYSKGFKNVEDTELREIRNVFYPSPEQYNSYQSIVSDGFETKAKELELESIYEDLLSSQGSGGISIAEQTSSPISEAPAVAETRATDPKLYASPTNDSSEQTASCQDTEATSGLCPKQPDPSVSLIVADEKGLPLYCRWLTETFHERASERPSGSQPAEITSRPLTRERILENMNQVIWRLASMQHLRDLPVRHQDLSDAGWFYDEDRDEFRCFCCPAARARELWNRGDNPEYLHRQISPGCPHLHPSTAISLRHNEVDDCDEDDDIMVTGCEAVCNDADEVSREENTDNASCSRETDVPASLPNQVVYLPVGKTTLRSQCYTELTDQATPDAQLDYSRWNPFEHTVDGVPNASSESEAVHSPSDYSSLQRRDTSDFDSLLGNETCDLAEDGENVPETECLSCSDTSQKGESVGGVRERHEPSHSLSRSNSHGEDCREPMTTSFGWGVREEEMISRLRTRRSDAFRAADDVSLSGQDLEIVSNPIRCEEAPYSSAPSPAFSHDGSGVSQVGSSFRPGGDTTMSHITVQTDSESSNLNLSQYDGLTGNRESGYISLSLRPSVTLSVSPVDVIHGETPLYGLSRNDEEDEWTIHLPAPSPRDLAGDQPDTTTTDDTSSPHTS